MAKHSYTVTCASAFKAAVEKLARARHVNVADLARSAILLLPAEMIEAFPDPGEPLGDDRERVVLKSGPSRGRPWQRKPRLQVRLPFGTNVRTVRRALNLMLSLAADERGLALTKGRAAEAEVQAQAVRETSEALEILRQENERLRAMLSALIPEPLSGGVTSRSDALFVMGFPPGSHPTGAELKERFRTLATIHHPDSLFGDHQRMSLLNAAMNHLKRGGF